VTKIDATKLPIVLGVMGLVCWGENMIVLIPSYSNWSFRAHYWYQYRYKLQVASTGYIL
jgi:hypothetical protein